MADGLGSPGQRASAGGRAAGEILAVPASAATVYPEPSAPQPGPEHVARGVGLVAAASVAGALTDAGPRVAAVAKDEVAGVVAETGRQVQGLWDRARHELTDQLGHQQQQVAAGLRSVGVELTAMARSVERPGVAADLVGQLAARAEASGAWLEQREPATLVADVASFARSRPGTFVLLAAGAGMLAGRISRVLVARRGPDALPDRAGAPVAGAIPAGGAAGVRPSGAGLGDGVGVGGSVFPSWPASAPQPEAHRRLR